MTFLVVFSIFLLLVEVIAIQFSQFFQSNVFFSGFQMQGFGIRHSRDFNFQLLGVQGFEIWGFEGPRFGFRNFGLRHFDISSFVKRF